MLSNHPNKFWKIFLAKFPNAEQYKWSKENKNKWECEFKISGKLISVNYLPNGEWLETEKEIDTINLPKAVSEHFKQLHPKSTILKVFLIELSKGIKYYEIEYKDGKKVKEVKMLENGSLTE